MWTDTCVKEASKTTTTTTINNQQMRSREGSNNTSHSYNSNNSGNTKHQSTTGNNCSIKLRSRKHPLPHRCLLLLTKKKVTGSSNNSCSKKESHVASNSMETPSQRLVTHGPHSPPSGPEQQNARASQKPRMPPMSLGLGGGHSVRSTFRPKQGVMDFKIQLFENMKVCMFFFSFLVFLSFHVFSPFFSIFFYFFL